MCVCDTKSTEIWEPPKPINLPDFMYNGRYKRPNVFKRWENRWNGIGNGPGGRKMYGRGGRSRGYGAGAGISVMGGGSSMGWSGGGSSAATAAGGSCGGGAC